MQYFCVVVLCLLSVQNTMETHIHTHIHITMYICLKTKIECSEFVCVWGGEGLRANERGKTKDRMRFVVLCKFNFIQHIRINFNDKYCSSYFDDDDGCTKTLNYLVKKEFWCSTESWKGFVALSLILSLFWRFNREQQQQ